jgi:hypothetical protein
LKGKKKEKKNRPSTRKHPRIPFEAKATFKGSKVWLVSQMKDLSEGGMYIKPLPKEDENYEADIEFSIPNKDFPVMAKGVVAWREDDTEHAGGGIRFTKLYRMDKELIREYIKKNKKCPI